MNRLRSKFVQLSPRTKQLIVIVGSAAALFLVIALFQGEPEKRVVYDKKKDQVANVLTDRSNRNVGLDRMSGQIRRLDQQTEDVQRDLAILKKSVDELKKDQTLNEIKKQVESLSGQFSSLENQQRRAVEAIDDVRKMRETGGKGEPNARGDRAGKTGDGMSISERLRANREKLAGDRVKEDGTIEGNPFAYPGAPGSADAGASGNAGAARPAASKKAPVRISVVSEKKDEAPVEEKEESAPEDAVAYILSLRHI